MAISIGDVLGGLGAAIGGTGQQYVQGLQQREQTMSEQKRAELEARQKAMYQDAGAAFQLLQTGDLDGIIRLGQDRLEMLKTFPDADPSDTARVVQNAMNAKSGDPMALRDLATELTGAYSRGLSMGVIKPAEQPKVFSVGGQLVDATGRVVYEGQPQRPKVYSVGGQLVDDSGQVVYAGRPESAPSVREREARVQELMDNFGLSRQDAIIRLDAQYMTDPITGNLIAVNRAAGTASIPAVATGERPAAIPAPPPVDVSELAFDPGTGTGAGAAFIGLFNSTVGQLPFVPTIMGPETAAQQLTILERDAIKALASSDRPAVVEQNRILGAIPKAMDWSENPNVARSKMTSFIDLMTNQYVDDLRYSKDLAQPKNLRETSATRARAIEGIINRVLTPEAATAMLDAIKGAEQGIQQINSVPFDQLDTISVESLDDAALDAYIERLKRG
jgi:hypothetical protein